MIASTVAAWMLLALAASPASPADGALSDEAALAAAFADRVAALRETTGRPAVERHPALDAAAEALAVRLARRGGEGLGGPAAIDRRIAAAGYEARAWSAESLFGLGGAEALWAACGTPCRERVIAEADDLGVGVESAGAGGTAVVLLLARSRLAEARRRLAALPDLEASRRRVLAAVNEVRGAEGLAPVTADVRLDEVAQRYAEALLERGRLDHVGRDGSTPAERVRRAGYRYRRVMENLARGWFEPEEVVGRWLASPGHRANVLARGVEQTGLGVGAGLVDGEAVAVWVQLFAAPR